MKKQTVKPNQQALLRAARTRLKVSNAELAALLGKSEPAILAWLAPETSGKFRNMPEGSQLLLNRILAEHKTKRKGKAAA